MINSFQIEEYSWSALEHGASKVNALINMHNGTIDGVLVRKVFNTNELSAIRSGISTISGQLFQGMDGGTTFPRIFATADQFEPNDEHENYFAFAEHIRKAYQTQFFALDLENRFERIFESLSGRKSEVPQGVNGKHSFLPFSIRILFPNEGGLPLHTDDEFLGVNEICSSHLSTFTDFQSHSSFFCLVSKPEKGGVLTFNSTTPSEKGTIVALEEGDLIVFRSQFIQHSVSSPLGLKNRITIGGFTGLGTKTSTLFFWS